MTLSMSPDGDECNWLPMAALSRSHDLSQACRQPCVQHFEMMVSKTRVKIHRCQEHKLTPEFIGKLQIGPRT